MSISNLFQRLSLSVVVLVAVVATGVASASEGVFNQKANETLGATLVAHCVTTHLNLDLIAQSIEADDLEEERANKLLDLHVQLLDQVGPRVIELTKAEDCGEEDRKVLEIIAKSYKEIKSEVKALQKYVESGEASDLEAFKTAQTAAQEQMDQIGK